MSYTGEVIRGVITFLFFSGIIGAFFMGTKSPEAYINALSPGDTLLVRSLQREMADLVGEKGIPYAVEVVAAAVKAERITNDDCHSLLHLIGHEAYQFYGNDVNEILNANKEGLCLGGYLHGVEAEMALEPGGQKILWMFCTAVKGRSLGNGTCYHGVGHALFERTRNVETSLAYCDSLAGGPEQEVWDCHRGVFSELGNQLSGTDSNTGMRIQPPIFKGIDPSRPFVFCDTLDDRFHESCYTQLSKVLYTDSLSETLGRCRTHASGKGEYWCIETVFGVFARKQQAVSSPKLFFQPVTRLPVSLQEAALLGILDGYGALVFSHQRPFNLARVCGLFTERTLTRHCEGAVKSP